MGLLLFVRSTDDLAPACRDAGKFLALRHRKADRDPHDNRVMGIWIHRRMITEVPSRLTLRLPTGETFQVAVTESFGLSGIWEFGRIEPVEGGLYRTVAEHFETWLELASADVFPRLAVRQWVLSVPKRLRYFLQRDGAALNTALRIFLRVIQGSLHQHCPGAARVDKAALRIGAVAFIHSFGSNLNTHVHLHVCVVDGVFEAVAGEGARGNDATAPPGVIFHPAQRLLSRCRCLHQVPRPPRAGAPAEVLRAPTVCYG